MLQEIVTYLIIGVAVTVAFYKIIKYFKRKKKNSKVRAQKEEHTSQIKCADCSEDCTLRDSLNPLSDENAGFCRKRDVHKV